MPPILAVSGGEDHSPNPGFSGQGNGNYRPLWGRNLILTRGRKFAAPFSVRISYEGHTKFIPNWVRGCLKFEAGPRRFTGWGVANLQHQGGSKFGSPLRSTKFHAGVPRISRPTPYSAFGSPPEPSEGGGVSSPSVELRGGGVPNSPHLFALWWRFWRVWERGGVLYPRLNLGLIVGRPGGGSWEVCPPHN